jgi:alanine dehydrogenase
VLLGGVPGVPPAKVVILGGGIVGINSAKMAAGMGARVVILDISLDRLRYLSDVMPANVQLIYSNRHNILDAIETADLGIGGGADSRREGAEARQARRPQADEERVGDRGRGGRPGWMR